METATELRRPRRAASAGPPRDLAEVAERIIHRFERRLVPVALRITTPVPRRYSLEDIGVSAAVEWFAQHYEPRTVMEGIYQHQLDVIAYLRAEEAKNIVLTSSTGSGKSFCYWVRVLDLLVQDPYATAVVLLPTQALAWSQADRMARISIPEWLVLRGGADQPAFAGEIDLPGGPIAWSIWKGTGTGETRDLHMAEHQDSEAFRRARIRICTLDKAHWSLLGRASESFASRLGALVLDEAHAYDGLFGANVHHFLRRVRVALACAGRPAPATFLASATLADAEGFARRLLDLGPDEPLLHVADGTEPRIESINVHDVPQALRMSSSSTAIERVVLVVDDADDRILLAPLMGRNDLVGPDANLLYFSANKFSSRRLLLRLGGADDSSASGRHPIVYDADLPPRQRREVERTFNSGHARGMTLIATNALELGVDIDGLDACLIDELPASRVDLIQRIGRVGRRAGRPGLVVLRAGGQPLDRILAADPAAALRPDAARSLPLPLHLEVVRWRHAIALHGELHGRNVRAAQRTAIIEQSFGVKGNLKTLKQNYRDRFASIVDMKDPFWMFKGFRASATQAKIPVAEFLDWADDGTRPRARYDQGERCDIAWLDDLLIFRDAHPEAVLLGADGRRWRVVAYGGDRPIVGQTQNEGDAIFSRWLQGLRIVFAELVKQPIATRGLFVDIETPNSPADFSEGAEPPCHGELVFGIWDVTRHWDGYREIDLETDAERRVSAADVAERFQQAVTLGQQFPFLHRWTFRTIGWEWRLLLPDLTMGPDVVTLVAALLARHVAAAVESTTSGLSVHGAGDGTSIALRVLDAQPGGNGLSDALLHDGRVRDALAGLRHDLDGCQGDEKAFVRLVHRVVGEDPHAPLAEVECVVAVLAESW